MADDARHRHEDETRPPESEVVDPAEGETPPPPSGGADAGASGEGDAAAGDAHDAGSTDDAAASVEEELARERDELRATLQRVQADFENFRKRMMREQAAETARATENLVEQLLPVLDSFELAVLSLPEGELDEASEKLRRGVDMVYAELLGVLEKAGLERLESLDRPFDPEEQEAVMREGEGNVVTEVMRTGYRFKGRVLRPAMVKVGGEAPSDSGEASEAAGDPGDGEPDDDDPGDVGG